MKRIYKFVRFTFWPLIILADYFQTNFTKYFTPMNMGPVTELGWSSLIRKNLTKEDFVLDYGCGVGFFCKLFNKKKYVGMEINKKFLNRAKIVNKGYNFISINEHELNKYKKKINAVLVNNVFHHLSNKQVHDALKLIGRNSIKKTKILIIEPTLPKKIFSLQFFLKALDIGNYIRTSNEYKKLLKNIKIKKSFNAKFGINDHIVIYGTI